MGSPRGALDHAGCFCCCAATLRVRRFVRMATPAARAGLLLIDGSLGEGGGQILRTSLALSCLLRRPLQIDHIRGNRSNPGLQRQHLACVEAAAAVGCADTTGAELDSSVLRFVPREDDGPAAAGSQPWQAPGGDYSFVIDSAGSTVLVLQTVLPVLLFARSPSTVTITGGTHTDMAPSADFVQRTFLPLLGAVGFRARVDVQRVGMFPNGGGTLRCTVTPVAGRLARLALAARPPASQHLLTVMHTRVDDSGRNRRAVTSAALSKLAGVLAADATRAGIDEKNVRVAPQKAPGASIVVLEERQVHVPMAHVVEGGDAQAKLAWSMIHTSACNANKLQARVAEQRVAYDAATGFADEYLADQLLLPLALGAGGTYRATCVSQHTFTNAWVLRQFLGPNVVRLHSVHRSGHPEVVVPDDPTQLVAAHEAHLAKLGGGHDCEVDVTVTPP